MLSRLSERWPAALELSGGRWLQKHRPPTESAVAAARAGARDVAADLGAGAREDLLHDATEREHDDDDQRRDRGDEQAVLDGRGATLVLAVHEALHEVKHVNLPW